jgi:hypothetical protein
MYFMIPFAWKVQNKHIHKYGKEASDSWCLGKGGGGDGGIMVKGCGFLFENVLKFIIEIVIQLC